MRKETRTVLMISAAILIMPLAALAHQPRLIEAGKIIQVQNPEVSQAFYGQLNGNYQEFKINADKTFDLYVNVLVPDLPAAKTDMSVEVFKLTPATTSLAVLEGDRFSWAKFYEPFSGDYYLRGPEFRREAGSGQYLIRVFSSGDKGKYSLVIGERESFSPGEIWRTLALLPALKKDFFNKSPWTAFFNYSGLYLLEALLFLAAIIFLIWRAAGKRKDAKKPKH